jgi:hypothetical protein
MAIEQSDKRKNVKIFIFIKNISNNYNIQTIGLSEFNAGPCPLALQAETRKSYSCPEKSPATINESSLTAEATVTQESLSVDRKSLFSKI